MSMSRGNVVAAVLVLFVLVASFALAEGSDSKGKFYFKKSCKTCHAKGGAGGEVTPLVKTQDQWKRYFDKGVHKKGAEKLLDVVPADQLENIQFFLVNHAADSPQPETCG
jgi:cytochrome c5